MIKSVDRCMNGLDKLNIIEIMDTVSLQSSELFISEKKHCLVSVDTGGYSGFISIFILFL